MDPEYLIGSLIRGVLTGGRRKRGRRAARYLAGGGGSFLNTSTLLTLAGLAWGLWESAQPKTTVAGSQGGSAGVPAPPLPDPGSSPPPEAIRLVRLTLSAARADGRFSPPEMDRILDLARKANAESLVQQEIHSPAPIAEITRGVADPKAKQDLYTLAFGIVHADEGVSGAERIYLAQLAQALGLDAETTMRLEREAQAAIAAEAEE